MFMDGWGRLLGYGSCALGIVFATTTTQLWWAAISCAGIIAQSLDG